MIILLIILGYHNGRGVHRDSDGACKAEKKTYQFQHHFGCARYKDTYRRAGRPSIRTMLKLVSFLALHTTSESLCTPLQYVHFSNDYLSALQNSCATSKRRTGLSMLIAGYLLIDHADDAIKIGTERQRDTRPV
ncbi:hypothetical protein EVAR_97272_1 [Eumeta japonica]|uniref:Uncharacterized protein n=1 Tax=Eumeta variegata TaxID=151549 RepID=A0A4C1XFG0_EUMVA|nr:hypothetical protein EVAR_97272_1 [Eumeta japonica]